MSRIMVGLVWLIPTTFTGVTQPAKPICKQAIEWALDHRTTLPTTLSGLSRYSEPYRRAIYGNLSREQKIALWHEHLASFRLANSGLTSVQRGFVGAVDDRLESLISAPDTARARAETRLLARQIPLLFGTDLGRRLFAFASLATEIAPVTHQVSLTRNPKQRVLEFCNCNPESESWDCGSLGSCREAGSDCWPLPSYPACGPLGELPCTGLCG